MKEAIQTNDAPKPVGPYCQAVKVGNMIFTSGQIGIDPKTDKLLEGLEAQTKQTFMNLSAVLTAAGSGLERVVKTTIFITDIANFSLVNSIYAQFFREPFPARSTVEVSRLPKGALVEVDAIAEI